MGVVYRARDARLERDVAVKVLPAALTQDPIARARLVREAQTASSLNHPHICHIYEVGEAEGQSFIAMELVEGRPLSALVSGGLPMDSVVRYGEQIADALAHAHERSVLHRDLKSANVLLTPEGRIKILDFGLAKRIEQDLADAATQSQVSPLTQAGSIAGTLHYLAPEVLSGAPADSRSDIWALGVVLYEMAAAALPFTGRTSFEVSSAILREAAPTLPARVPPGLRAVILRCLAKVPTERYQRAGEVRAALEALSSSAHISPAVPPAAETPASAAVATVVSNEKKTATAKRRDDLYAMAFGVLLLLLSGVLIAYLLQHRNPPDSTAATTLPAPSGAAATSAAVPAPPATASGRLITGGKASPNPEASAYFEKAMLFLHSRFELPRAVPLLKKALDLDPQFAEARATLGLTHLLQVESGVSNESSWLYEAEKELRHALHDDPESVSAHGLLSGVYLYQGRKEEAFAEGERLLASNPNLLSGLTWHTWVLQRRGDYAGAMAAARRNIQINPVFFPSQWALGELLLETGDLAGGVRQLGKVLEQDSQNQFVLSSLAHMHIESSDTKTARMFLEQVRKSDAANYRVRLTRALLLAREGKRREASREMDEAVRKYAEVNPRVTLQVAEFYSVLSAGPGHSSERQTALDWLEKAVRAGDERIEWFQRNRLLDNIREERRFQQIVDSIAYLRTQRQPAK
jgi:serine/threonine protein kinase/Tfp pilus assembly protein PilF